MPETNTQTKSNGQSANGTQPTTPVKLTDDQIKAINVNSQAFAELSTDDKLRWFIFDNQRLRVEAAKPKGKLRFNVSEKGAVSVYGIGRFPTTLYYGQWLRILETAEELKQFLEDNKDKLSMKDGNS